MLELWPFTNFHDLNLDWIIKTIEVYTQKVDDFVEDMTDTWDAFKLWVSGEIDQMHEDFAQYVNVTEGALNTGAIADGAVTLPKLAPGILNYVTPEMYGAVGDGVEDDTQAIIDALAAHDYILGTGSYLISGTITIPSNKKIILDAVEYTDTDYAFELAGSYIDMNINYFVSHSGGFIKSGTAANVSWSNINVGNVWSETQCIYINADLYTNTFLKFNGRFLTYNSSYPCAEIEITLTSGAKYANEIEFYGSLGVLNNANKGLYAHAKSSQIQVKLIDVDLENSTGVKLDKVNSCALLNCRGNEIFAVANWLEIENMISGSHFIYIENCTGTLTLSNISYDATSTSYIRVDATRVNTGTYTCYDCMIYHSTTYGIYIYSESMSQIPGKTITDTQTLEPRAYCIPSYLLCTNAAPATVTMPYELFRAALIRNIYPVVQNADVTFNFQNSGGNTVKSITLSAGKYHIILLDNTANAIVYDTLS